MLFKDCKIGHTYNILYCRICNSIRKEYNQAKLVFTLHRGINYSPKFLIKIFGIDTFRVKSKLFIFNLGNNHYVAIPSHSKLCTILGERYVT